MCRGVEVNWNGDRWSMLSGVFVGSHFEAETYWFDWNGVRQKSAVLSSSFPFIKNHRSPFYQNALIVDEIPTIFD